MKGSLRPLTESFSSRQIVVLPKAVPVKQSAKERPSHRTFQAAELARRTCDAFVCRAAASLEYGQLADADAGVDAESYLVLGLATCFEQNEAGKLQPREVIEPIAANSLECMVLGAKTCFKVAHGMTIEEALQRDKTKLPEEFQEATYCSEFDMRCAAAARTWNRPHAIDNLSDLVPLGRTRRQFNFNIEEKRVLNFENEVNDSDNIKQDMSIDVYGRSKEDEPAPTPAKAESKPAAKQAPKAAKDEDDDDLDALLAD